MHKVREGELIFLERNIATLATTSSCDNWFSDLSLHLIPACFFFLPIFYDFCFSYFFLKDEVPTFKRRQERFFTLLFFQFVYILGIFSELR